MDVAYLYPAPSRSRIAKGPHLRPFRVPCGVRLKGSVTGRVVVSTAIVLTSGFTFSSSSVATAEVYAPQFQAVGVQSYSSAVFTFHPVLANRFFEALRGRDQATVSAMLRDFYIPLVELRDRKRGYSVSIVKAGLRAMGMPAGPVRPPLVDLDAEEQARLVALIQGAARWIG